MIHHLTSIQEYTNALQNANSVFVYKFNSRGCRVSEHTILELQSAIHEFGLESVYLIDVIISKKLSDYITKNTGIQHESPQLILYKKGNPVAYTSHMHITKEYISNLIKR